MNKKKKKKNKERIKKEKEETEKNKNLRLFFPREDLADPEPSTLVFRWTTTQSLAASTTNTPQQA